jgi:hypothetical protein
MSGTGYNSVKIQLTTQVAGTSHVSILGPSVSATVHDKVTVIDFTTSSAASAHTANTTTATTNASVGIVASAGGSHVGGIGYNSRALVTSQTISATKTKANGIGGEEEGGGGGGGGGAGIPANQITIQLLNTTANAGSATDSDYNSNVTSDFFVVHEISVFYDDRSIGVSSSSGGRDTRKGMHK